LNNTIHSRLATMAARTLSKQSIKSAGRTFGPVLIALALSPLAAHAQGTVDVSGVTTAMGTIEKSCLLGGALAVVIGIVFGVFQFMGRNISGGFMAIGGGLFAGIVIGFAPQWVSSLTGQSISMVVTHAVTVLA
jgi:flagellar biosynthesis protein FliR